MVTVNKMLLSTNVFVSTSVNPDKVYLWTAEGEFKKRYYNHTKLFRHCSYAKETTFSKYVREIKDKCNETPFLK